MRASRLLSILLLLQTRGQMSARALAGEFEVSVRSIHRDIDDLSAAGVPVYAERGRFGGFRLLDSYSTRLTGLTRTEIEALFLTGLPGPATDLGLGKASSGAKLKLLASMPRERRELAERVASRFHLDPIGWYQNIEQLPLLPKIAAAIWEPQKIGVKYESWKAVVNRVLNPLGLVLKGGVWYLVASSGGAIRTYRVSKILTLKLTGETFERPDRFSLPDYWKSWSEDFETRIFSSKATLRLSPEGLNRLSLLPPMVAEMAAQTVGAPDEHGWVSVKIPIESFRQAESDILRLGADAEIAAPKELRRQIKKTIAKLNALYAR